MTGEEHGGWVAPGSRSEPEESAAPQPAPPMERPVPPEPEGPAGPAGPPEGPGGPAAAHDWWVADVSPDFGIGSARRLSPRSMVVGPVNQLRGLLLPIAAGLFVGGFNIWVLGGTAATIVALLVGGFVTWQTTRYEVVEDRLEIRRGLVRRSRRTIPLERVRGVDVTSTLLHRLLGVAVVRIEAAAGAPGVTEDGKLDAVAADEADRLRRVLLHRRAVLTGQGTQAEQVPAAAGDGGTEDAEEGVTHFSMPRSWYLYGALGLGYLLTPFAVLAALFGAVQQTAGELANEYVVDWVLASDRALLTLFAAVFAGILVLLMPVFAVISYTIAHWGFTLSERDGSLVAERGLFTRRSVTLEKRRIRGYELRDSPLERLRGAVRLSAVVTGLGDTGGRAVLLPTGPRGAVEEVVEAALSRFSGTLVRHPGAALGRRLLRSVGPPALVAAVAALLGAYWLAGAAAVLAGLGIPLGVDRYRSLGHGYDGGRVSVRSGSLSRSQATVEAPAVIGWTWRQTLFQRRSGLADLQVNVGAGAGGYTAGDASLEESVAFAARVTPEMVRPFLESAGEGARSSEPSTRPSSRRT